MFSRVVSRVVQCSRTYVAARTPAAASEAVGAGSRHSWGGVRQLSTSGMVRGLEEFFPPGPANEHAEADEENCTKTVLLDIVYAPDGVLTIRWPEERSCCKTGRAWKARDLRIKSNVELHQLWYILLKERNMLLTVKQDALRAQERFPAPDRLRKVRHSMRSVKVVIGERERAAQAAAEQEPEKWSELREDVDVDTGLRRQVGSEKKGKVSRQPPNAAYETPEQSESQYKQLLGVTRPGLAAPGQPQRPMTKPERAKFRRELQEARTAIVTAKIETIRNEVEEMDDERLAELVAQAEDELLEGWEPEELSQRHLVALHEAYARGLKTFFEPRKISGLNNQEAVARFQHGLEHQSRVKSGKIPQKWAYAPVEPLDWQGYVKRRNVRVAAEKAAAEKAGPAATVDES